MRPFRPILLAVASTAPLFGCAPNPVAEAPIVLNPPQPVKRVAQHVGERRRPAAPAAAAPLTPAQKESLFRDFDSYLQQSGTE